MSNCPDAQLEGLDHSVCLARVHPVINSKHKVFSTEILLEKNGLCKLFINEKYMNNNNKHI